MIDPNLITTTTTYSGQQNLSTLNGTISLQTGRGRLVVSNANGTEKTYQDINGFHVNNDNGDEVTLIDTRGINTIDPSNGTYRGRWGIATTDNRPFGGFSKTGQDIRTLLGE
jgi:hypothetical protein